MEKSSMARADELSRQVYQKEGICHWCAFFHLCEEHQKEGCKDYIDFCSKGQDLIDQGLIEINDDIL